MASKEGNEDSNFKGESSSGTQNMLNPVETSILMLELQWSYSMEKKKKIGSIQRV